MTRRRAPQPYLQPDDVGMMGPTTPNPTGYRFNPRQIYGRRAPDESYFFSQRSQTFSTTFNRTAADGSALVLPANPARVLLVVQNLSSADPMYVNFGKDAFPTDGIRIIAGGNLLLDYACPTDDVFAYMDSAGGSSFIVASRIILPSE